MIKRILNYEKKKKKKKRKEKRKEKKKGNLTFKMLMQLYSASIFA